MPAPAPASTAARRLPHAGLLLAGLLLLGLAAVGETPGGEESGPRPEEGVFVDTVDVNVVNVDVYVTDRKGNRVLGLQKEDFEILEDGRPVQVTNFYAVEGGKVREDVELPDLPPPPEDDLDLLRRGEEPDLVPEEQQLHLIVYVDNFNLHPLNRNRALGAIRAFLRRDLGPHDRVMLVTYDRSLHVRYPFTTNKEMVASALYELEELSGHAVHADADRRQILQTVFDDNPNLDPRSQVVSYAESRYHDLRFTIDTMKQFVDELAGLPGRKAMLYVSDGLPMKAAEDVFHALAERDVARAGGEVLLEAHRFDASRLFQQLTAKANANRVMFYTLDAAGLRTYSLVSAQNQSFSRTGSPSRVDQIHIQNLQTPLHLLANETGGMAIVNTNNFEPYLDRVAEDFESYYSLGYRPAHQGSGRLHRLEVRVKGRKKLRIRHREAYRDKPVEARIADTTLASLHFGYQRNALGVELELGRGERRQDGHYLVPLLVKIPISRLSFLPYEEVHRGRVRLFVAARDSEGRLAPVQEIPVPIDIPAEEFGEAQEHDYEYLITLLMREGRQVVAVGVRDEVGAVSSFVTRGTRIGA